MFSFFQKNKFETKVKLICLSRQLGRGMLNDIEVANSSKIRNASCYECSFRCGDVVLLKTIGIPLRSEDDIICFRGLCHHKPHGIMKLLCEMLLEATA
jgi:hypothetical protein